MHTTICKIKNDGDLRTGESKIWIRKGKVEVLRDSTRRLGNERDTILRRKLSTYECGRTWCIHRRWMDADGDESAVAGKLAGRLRMNGTNVWGWSVASHYFTRATGAGPAATRWSSNPCWPMDQPDNLCYLTRPLEICLWYMLGLEISTTNDSRSSRDSVQQFQRAIVSIPREVFSISLNVCSVLVDVKSEHRFIGLLNACERNVW